MLAAFILSCMIYQTKAQLLEDNAVQIYPYNAQIAAESDETTAAEEIPAETSNLSYYGQCRITFYCAGSCCCGAYATGYTANGSPVQANHTAANGALPFGTVIVVDGQEYVVEDRGVGAYEIDIYVPTHQEALNRGLYYTDVYIKG